jgi:hypothetical protein
LVLAEHQAVRLAAMHQTEMILFLVLLHLLAVAVEQLERKTHLLEIAVLLEVLVVVAQTVLVQHLAVVLEHLAKVMLVAEN